MNNVVVSFGSAPASFIYGNPKTCLQSTNLKLQPINSRHVSFNTNLSKQLNTTSRNVVCTAKSEESDQSFYDLLGISIEGTILEIKNAYKRLAKKFHPDVSPPEKINENTKKFLKIQLAYETLSDPRARASYDRVLFGCDENFIYRPDLPPYDEWKTRWQAQLVELRRISKIYAATKGNGTTWGDLVRNRRDYYDQDFN